ncbi:hypothetical protein [Escherichia phage vB_EcoP_PAS7]|uniref:Uncharacterized protein n=1 Tax=Escherichia phage vB_EcoP_PAS7 TaxID=3053875 RepID=A0AA51VHI2_9CAUD|nr:hypothetical protein [Escherichia phage vB_EcoP_PAS7]
MTRYGAGAHTFRFGSGARDRIVVPDAGTTVTVEYWSGTEWVMDVDSPIDSPATLYTRLVRVRLTADGGFSFDVVEAIDESN